MNDSKRKPKSETRPFEALVMPPGSLVAEFETETGIPAIIGDKLDLFEKDHIYDPTYVKWLERKIKND